MGLRSAQRPHALLVFLFPWVLTWAFTGTLLWRAPGAQADGSFRTVLVIDASSSMRRTDPRELRKVAAELYVDMARDGDQIAVTGFDQRARESTGQFIPTTDMAARRQLKQAIRAVGSDGKWTDFTAGLMEAQRLLATADKRPGDQELVVFLTDGKCEPDPEGAIAQEASRLVKKRQIRRKAEELCRDRVLGQFVDTLQQTRGGARVYAIGLSRNAPAVFLEELGRRTGGQGAVTLEPGSLPQLFAGVYARLLGSQLQEGAMARTKAGASDEFEVLGGAESLNLVIVGRSDETEIVTDPTGTEIAIDNRHPDRVYFAAAREYRFFKIRKPTAGRWRLAAPDRKVRRFAALQHFDLELAYVDPPRAAESGQRINLVARLASPAGAMPPAEFLDRHRIFAVASEGTRAERELELARRPDGTFAADMTAPNAGAKERPATKIALALRLEPRPGGVLSRKTKTLATVEVIPPVHLLARPIALGEVKQGTAVAARLSLAGSEAGVPLSLSIEVKNGEVESGDFRLDKSFIELLPDGERIFALKVAVSEDAPAGAAEFTIELTPTSPRGFEDRAAVVTVTAQVIALTLWERYGSYIKYGGGAVLLLFVLLGIAGPARFKKRVILYYIDMRDPELARRSSYPLGARAKRGFYRAARALLGPSGPVEKGGVVELRAGSGGAIFAVPLAGGAAVHRRPVPGDGEDEFDDFGADAASDSDLAGVPLKDGRFRVAAGVGYEIAGSGLVFWYK